MASSRNGTPQGSRPGSPTPVHAGGGGATKGKRLTILFWLFSEMLQLWHTKSVMVRRSNSSLNPSTHRSTKFPNPCRNPCCDPQSGILSKDLLKIFHPRLGDSRDNQQRFIALVKNVGVYGKDRLLRPGLLKES